VSDVQGPADATVARVRPKRSRLRALWVLGFSIGFLPLIPLIFATLLSLEYLPWLIVSGSLTVGCGYEIWHADHPGANARRQATTLAVRSVAFLASAAGLAFGREHPAIVAGAIAIFVVLLVGLGIVLSSLERGVRPPAVTSVPHGAAPPDTSDRGQPGGR